MLIKLDGYIDTEESYLDDEDIFDSFMTWLETNDLIYTGIVSKVKDNDTL